MLLCRNMQLMKHTNSSTDIVAGREEQLSVQLTNILNAELAELDVGIVRKLSKARHEAIADIRYQPTWGRLNWQVIVSTGGVTAMLTLLTVASLESLQWNTSDNIEDDVALSNSTKFPSEDDTEFYNSLDFLFWLEQQRV